MWREVETQRKCRDTGANREREPFCWGVFLRRKRFPFQSTIEQTRRSTFGVRCFKHVAVFQGRIHDTQGLHVHVLKIQELMASTRFALPPTSRNIWHFLCAVYQLCEQFSIFLFTLRRYIRSSVVSFSRVSGI